MSLVERVQSILLRPKETWPTVAAEAADPASIYTRYLVILAAIPAIAAFIGLSVIGISGISGFAGTLRLPIATGLVNMVLSYVLSLAIVYVVALIVDALAPTFGGTKDRLAALKLVAYASTAAFVGGIFSLIPAIAFLGMLAALYSIYLFYTGVAVLMRSPADKSAAYTAVVVVCTIVVGVVMAAFISLLVPTSPLGVA